MVNASDLVYRRLTEDDLDEVAALEAAAFPTPWTAGQYRAVLRQDGCLLFGARLEKTLVGYIAIAAQRAVGEIEVYNIAVAEGWRRKGIGRKLLALSLEAAVRNGMPRAFLEVRVSNAPAVALYRSLGFKEVGLRPNYYRDTNEDAYVFMWSPPE
jgi:ribosomal-protein-alanine N-acetyltransferase